MSTGFGGGDFRDGIEISVRDNGSAAADAVAEAMRHLRDAIAGTYQEIAAGGPTTNEAVARLKGYQSQLVQLERAHVSIAGAIERVTEAERARLAAIANGGQQSAAWAGVMQSAARAAADAAEQIRDLAALQDYLGRKEQEAAKAVAESDAAWRAAAGGVSEQVGKYQALAAAKRDGTEATRAWAAALAGSTQQASSWAAVLQNAAKSAADQAQQVRDLAALQEYLGKKEQETARDAAAEAAAWDAAGGAAQAQVGKYQALAEAKRRAAEATRQQAADEGYLDRQTRQLADAMDSLARHEATATKAIDASAGASGAASPKYSKMGMAAIEAARGVEDLQFGLYAAMNNLAQAVTILGGPVGAIVGVTLLGVAVSQLAKHWDELMVGMAQDPLEKLADDAATLKRQIEDLEKKPTKLDIDISVLDEAKRKLDEIEEKRQAYEAAARAMTDTQGKVAAAVRHAVVETAGGTDEESGTENLARAIGESRARRGRFISPEDSRAIAAKEAEVARLRKLVASPAPGEDAQSIAQQKAFLEQQEQQLGLLNQAAVKRAQERVKTDLIGGALRGIDARRAEIQAEVAADPEFFRRRGIGDQFAGAIDLASAENQRALARTDVGVRQQQRAHQTEEVLRTIRDRQAQEDKARTDEGRRIERMGDELQIQARKKGVPLLTDITGSLDDLDARAEAKDARADTKEARERAAEVARLARQNARALQGAGGDLTANVLAGMGMGMTPEQMAAQLAPAAGARLAQVPGINPADVQAVAEKAVADEIAKQAPNATAQHAAAAFAGATDANPAQVLAMTRRAVQLNAQGLDMQLAEQRALFEMATQINLSQQRYAELSNSLAAVQQQLRMTAGHNNTDGRTRVPAGRRGPGG